MRKGGGSTSLTGGTGDVNPQLLVWPESTTNPPGAYTSFTMNLPVSRLPTSKGKSIVMELLKVCFLWPPFTFLPGGGVGQGMFRSTVIWRAF